MRNSEELQKEYNQGLSIEETVLLNISKKKDEEKKKDKRSTS